MTDLLKEAVATVCLVGERYAHGNMVEVQLQLASEDAPTPKIGDRYYTHPPKPVVSDEVMDALNNLIDAIETYMEYDEDSRVGEAVARGNAALGVKS